MLFFKYLDACVFQDILPRLYYLPIIVHALGLPLLLGQNGLNALHVELENGRSSSLHRFEVLNMSVK